MTDRGIPTDRETFTAGLLRLYLFFRFFLSLLLLGVYAARLEQLRFGSQNPDLYFSSAIIYVVITVITLGFYQIQNHRLREPQLLITIVTDIVIYTILMFASAGLQSGIGYLLLVTVAVGSIFYTGQLAVLIPSLATISLIVEALIANWFFGEYTDELFPAGVLGVLLFLTSLLFSRLSNALIEAQDQALTESRLSAGLQELNQLVLERIRTGLVVVDNQGVINQINTSARELLGRKPNNRVYAIGDSIRTEPRLLRRLLAWRKNPAEIPKPFIPRFGNTELQVSFADLEQRDDSHAIVFLEDFRAAAQQAQQLKLASLGRLTGSIAHEIRNPLGAISHASELLEEIREDDKTTARLTEIIRTHVHRVNHIVESVLQLSRKQDHHIERLEIDNWLGSFINTYLQGAGQDVEVELDIQEDPGTVVFDPVQLQQVLTNLLDNALRHSAMETGRKWCRVAVRSSDSNQSGSTLDVIDCGPGVPPEHRKQLFEPFFTTSSSGSGLGLFIARELCTINYATIKYQPPTEDQRGYFRITFLHPKKNVKIAEDGHE